MNCDEANKLLDAYVDQELFLKDSLEVEKHIKVCNACEKKYTNILSMQDVFKQCKKYKPSMSLQDSIQNELKNESAHSQYFDFNNWFKFGGPSFVMGLLVTAIFSYGYFSPTESNFYTEEILDSHIRSMMASHITDVSSSDKHQLKPWLNKVLDYSPPIEDFSTSGYPLLGARLDYINQRQVVALVYQVRNHYINVFIWPVSADQDDKANQKNIRGYDIHYWSTKRLAYTVVSDLSYVDLGIFVQKLKNISSSR